MRLAVTGLPIASLVRVVLLLGDAATSQMPVVIMVVVVVVAIVIEGQLSNVVAPVAEPYPVH